MEDFAQQNKTEFGLINTYYSILKTEAPQILDSYMLYVEKNRKRRDRFYEPRRKTLKLVTDKLQMLEDDELDELFVHMPARVGKSQELPSQPHGNALEIQKQAIFMLLIKRDLEEPLLKV